MPWTLDQIAVLIGEYKYLTGTEAEFQNGLARVLETNRIEHRREYDLGSDYGRIDFFLPEQATGIELKVKGSPSGVLRQLHRYAQCPEIRSLLLVTSRVRLAFPPMEISGKAVRSAAIWLGQF